MEIKAQLGAVFALMGAASASLPATIPMRANQLDIPVAQLMPGIPALFLGLFLGIAITPVVSRHLGVNNHVRQALGTQALGVLGIAVLDANYLFVLSALALGFGFGQLEVLITSISRVVSKQVGNLLTRLGIYLASTAFLTPIGIIALDFLDVAKGINLLIVMLSIFIIRILNLEHFEIDDQSNIKFRISNKTTYTLILAISFYVGAETILAGWSAVLFSENISKNLTSAPLGTSIFWAGMTLGRVIGTYFSSKTKSTKITALICSLGLSLSLITLTQVSKGNSENSFLLLFLFSIFFAGPCYGFILGFGVMLFHESMAIKSSTLFVLLGSLGGVAIPVISQIYLGSESKNIVLGAAVAASLSTLFLIASSREKVSKGHQS